MYQTGILGILFIIKSKIRFVKKISAKKLAMTKSNHVGYFWYNEIHASYKRLLGLPVGRMFIVLDLHDVH